MAYSLACSDVEAEAESLEAAIFYGSGKCEINGSRSSKKNIGSGSDTNLRLPLLGYLRLHFSFV